MRIESVTVCCGYADYLRHSLPFIKACFDRSVVVSDYKDKDTHKVCDFYNVECLQTDVMYSNGDVFNKGLAVNKGLQHLDFREWAVHIDADTCPPPRARQVLQEMQLNEQFLMGVDRMMVPDYSSWERFLQDPLVQHEQAYVHLGPFPMGLRLIKPEVGGYVPLGYFQMFHRASNFLGKAPFYPEDCPTAAVSDLLFAAKWPRTHRHLLAEFSVYHLATEDITMAERMGINWEGRKSMPFGPKDPYWYYKKRPVRGKNEEKDNCQESPAEQREDFTGAEDLWSVGSSWGPRRE
jgi:hypothetical protein